MKPLGKDQIDALLRYLKPMHSVLARSALLKKFSEEESNASITSAVNRLSGAATTYVERKEELKLLISFEDSKWICATLWKHFFTSVQQAANTTTGAGARNNDHDDKFGDVEEIETLIEKLSPTVLAEK